MKAIFDKNKIDLELFDPGYNNRAFQYGDGMFETILCRNRQIQLLDDHLARIRDGCKMLSLVLPDYFSRKYIEDKTRELIRENKLSGTVRIKVLIWRKTGGLYEPKYREMHHLILADPFKEKIPRNLRRVAFCKTIVNYPSPWSAFKTQSSLPYVLAGIEKEENDLEDIILTDMYGNVSELLYSNIFWIRNNTFFTPSLKTGCIRGVMRTHLIRKLKELNIPSREVMEGKSVLLEADHVFSANITGLIAVTGVESHRFQKYADLTQLLP